ncbi:MAG: GDSL-type esterase/lipase family protein [Minwuia sp.]|uniref:GDSL-type esterase/lipase family protein n=1 Tax=Minwuia sp. TaxID=2493630 RepID=UPI003A874C30
MSRRSGIAGAILLAGIALGGCETQDIEAARNVLEGAQLVIVSMGNSFASGEGNPDVLATANESAKWQENAAFASGLCHRSAINAHRFAVAAVTDAWTLSDEEIYASFACSGASTRFGLRLSRRGNANICQLPAPAAPPSPYCGEGQIATAKAWAEDPENGVMRIDVVILSIGLNDLGFGSIVKACVTPKPTPFHPDCHQDPGITEMLQHGCTDAQDDDDPSDLPTGCGGIFRSAYGGFDRVQGRVEREIRRIREELDPRHILLVGYPDPSRNENGNFCNRYNENFIAGIDVLTGQVNPGGTGIGWMAIPFGAATSEVTGAESRFAFEEVLTPLNEILADAAAAEGAHFVDGLAALTREHGVCSSDPWFHGFKSSFARQDDEQGVLHPNQAGHEAMAAPIEAKLRAVLGLPPA